MAGLKEIIKFKAKDNFELGQKLGAYFGAQLRKLITFRRTQGLNVKKALKYLPPTQESFPHLIEELKGYALAAKVDWEDLWTLGLEGDDETNPPSPRNAGLRGAKEKCTSIITKNGLAGHTEDWFAESADKLFLIEKQIGDLKILEFFYFYSFGGNAFSVNSHGIIKLTNSLAAKDTRLGIPNHVVARWLSETADPEKGFLRLKKLKRAAGEGHIFINIKNCKVYSMETTAKKQVLTKPELPFVHTNHYLTKLVSEEKTRSVSSIARFNFAQRAAPLINNTEEMGELFKIPPIFRDDPPSATIATAIVDLHKKVLHYRVNKTLGQTSIVL